MMLQVFDGAPAPMLCVQLAKECACMYYCVWAETCSIAAIFHFPAMTNVLCHQLHALPVFPE